MKTTESTVRHTPGPWEAYGAHVYAPGENGANVCSCGSPRADKMVGYTPLSVTDPDLKEAYSNARLIGSAPDLLNALQLLTAYARDFATNENAKAVIRICESAIAKAEGRKEKQ